MVVLVNRALLIESGPLPARGVQPLADASRSGKNPASVFCCDPDSSPPRVTRRGT